MELAVEFRREVLEKYKDEYQLERGHVFVMEYHKDRPTCIVSNSFAAKCNRRWRREPYKGMVKVDLDILINASITWFKIRHYKFDNIKAVLKNLKKGNDFHKINEAKFTRTDKFLEDKLNIGIGPDWERQLLKRRINHRGELVEFTYTGLGVTVRLAQNKFWLAVPKWNWYNVELCPSYNITRIKDIEEQSRVMTMHIKKALLGIKETVSEMVIKLEDFE